MIGPVGVLAGLFGDLWDKVTGIFRWGAGAAADVALGGVAQLLEHTVAYLVRSVHNLVVGLTTLVVGEVLKNDQGLRKDWFEAAAGAATGDPTVYGLLWWLAIVLMVALLLVRMGRAALTASPRESLKALFADMPAAFVGWALFVPFVWVLVYLTQALSEEMLESANVGFTQFYSGSLFANVETSAAGLGAVAGDVVVSLLVMLMWIFGAFMIWIQLLVRSAFIFLALAVSPVVFATAVGGNRDHIRKFSANTAALVLSKLIIVVTVTLGSTLYSASASTAAEVLGDKRTVVASTLCPSPAPHTLRIYVSETYGDLDVFYYAEEADGSIAERHITAERSYPASQSTGYAYTFAYSGALAPGTFGPPPAYVLRLADGASLAWREQSRTSIPIGEWVGPAGVIWADNGGRLHMRAMLYPAAPFLDESWAAAPHIGVGTLLGPTLPNPAGAEPDTASYERLRAWSDPPNSPYADPNNYHASVFHLGLDRATALSEPWVWNLFGVTGDPRVEVLYTRAGPDGAVTCAQTLGTDQLEVGYSVSAQAAAGAMLVAAAFSPMALFNLLPSVAAGGAAAGMMTSGAGQMLSGVKGTVGRATLARRGGARGAAAAARAQGATPSEARQAGRDAGGGGAFAHIGGTLGALAGPGAQARAHQRVIDGDRSAAAGPAKATSDDQRRPRSDQPRNVPPQPPGPRR